jgi:hypothetical protein
MYINRTEISAILRSRGMNDRADWVDRALPPLVDTYDNRSVLRMLDIDVATLQSAEVPSGAGQGSAAR